MGRVGRAPGGRTRAWATTGEWGGMRAPKLWLRQSRSAWARKSKRTHTRACLPPQTRAVGSVDGTLEPHGFNRGSSQSPEVHKTTIPGRHHHHRSAYLTRYAYAP